MNIIKEKKKKKSKLKQKKKDISVERKDDLIIVKINKKHGQGKMEGDIITKDGKLEKGHIRIISPDKKSVNGINYHGHSHKLIGRKKDLHVHVDDKSIRIDEKPTKKLFMEFVNDPEATLKKLLKKRVK